MAVYQETKAAPFGAITTFRIVRALDTVKNSFAMWNAKRETYKQLSKLSLRELDDIGITRSDVENLNAGFFHL